MNLMQDKTDMNRISNSSVTFAIDFNLQAMYMSTRPHFVLRGMVALPFLITLCLLCLQIQLLWRDSSSVELWLSVDTHHDTRIRAEASAILTFTLNVWGMFAHSAKYVASSI